MALLGEKLISDINRLRLGEGTLLDPTKFGQGIEAYSEAVRSLNEEYGEKREVLTDIARIMRELAEVTKENASLIGRGVMAAEAKSETQENRMYGVAMKEIRTLGKQLEAAAICGNIDSLFAGRSGK